MLYLYAEFSVYVPPEVETNGSVGDERPARVGLPARGRR